MASYGPPPAAGYIDPEIPEQVATAQLSNSLFRGAAVQVQLPRVTIQYCTQCRWMLRAAYYGQELLSTFSTILGEVALIPSTSGTFTISILYKSDADFATQETMLWDRRLNGGFPETKQLKSLVRNIIDPNRGLGHIDRAMARSQLQQQQQPPIENTTEEMQQPAVMTGAAPPPPVMAVPPDESDIYNNEKASVNSDICEDCQ
ncbi:hypothetical protein LOZ12_004048 [Ophidiomyces ophidiicola]|nr:hypothetical protein LOZ38_000848 [Ophidiomyces ophidiicola]KAI2075499.1 hypothetical protein LOZ37_003524 [Ophidiomyces ophidiicola]KAI2113402.1 hypothetical protein LOZ42_004267 [Ophidiomyces ophidiicola]KAI2178446.1 hypothetical protein LOZ24_002142 [Ophidiomyces ophidiicola]KAI2197534.1 hypothetical protein LOZ18_004519 [Ophidiomyces ophidiicola]